MSVIRADANSVYIKVKWIVSAMKEWVMAHADPCEVIGPKAGMTIISWGDVEKA